MIKDASDVLPMAFLEYAGTYILLYGQDVLKNVSSNEAIFAARLNTSRGSSCCG